MSTEMILRSLDDVTSLAQIAIASKLTKLSRVEEAAVILMTGRELGLQPMQSLRGIYVVDGKPTLSADMMVAVIRGSGLCESWCVVESTAERCTITTRRKGEQHDATRTWTKADATLAGVAGKDTWRKYPAAMLRHRCAADLARQEYPDVLLGLYDPEELGADAASVQQHAPYLAPGTPSTVALPAPPSWSEDLARCATLRDVRARWAAHRTPDTDGAAMAGDVRAWLDARGLSVTAEGVTALLSTLHDDAVDAFSLALSPVNASAEAIETAIVTAAHALRSASVGDAASRGIVWKVLRRAYAKLTAAESLDAAGEALRAAVDARDGDDPEPDGDGTDGRGKGSASDDGDDGSAAAYEAHRAAQGERAQVTELRVVREESSDPCVTSAAAWAAHLATLHSKWHVCGSFRKRASAFSAEGVHAAREAATLDRLRALGEAAPRTLLYAPPAAPKKRAA